MRGGLLSEQGLLLLLLLLSHFSRVRLCDPIDGRPPGSPVPGIRPTLSNPMDCSPPGSSIHGTLQARVLEWGVIAGKHPKDIRVKHYKTWEQKGALGVYQISKTHRKLEKWAPLSHSMRNMNLEEVKLLKVTLCGAKHHENPPPPPLQRRMWPPILFAENRWPGWIYQYPNSSHQPSGLEFWFANTQRICLSLWVCTHCWAQGHEMLLSSPQGRCSTIIHFGIPK